MMFIFLLQFITIPLDILNYKLQDLDEFESTLHWRIFRTILDICTLIDCSLNFITGYYDNNKKEVVLEPRNVARCCIVFFLYIFLESLCPTVGLP